MAAVLLFTQITFMIPAQEIRIDREAGKIRLEQYLDRAARERKAEKWERLADEGILAALNEWESGSLCLKENDYERWVSERAETEAFYKTEKEKRYVEWVSERYYEQTAVFESGLLMKELRAAASEWEYEGQGEQPTRKVGLEHAADAYGRWEGEAEKVVNEYISKWTELQGAAYSELSGRVQGSGLSDEEIQEIFTGSAEKYYKYLLSEYTRISEAEANTLMGQLLYDQDSKKKMSASEAASVLAREMAAEAKKETEKAIDSIFGEFDTIIQTVEGEELALEQKGWLDKFRKTFEESLSKWEAAELTFLTKRSEWEKEAEQIYTDSEQVWAAAYEQLREERRQWENTILTKFSEGVKNWEASGKELEKQLKEVESELVKLVQEERNKKEKLAAMQIQVYNQSREMLVTAVAGINNWYDRWGEKYRSTYSYWKTEDNKSEYPTYFTAGEIEGIQENEEANTDIQKLLNGGIDTLTKQLAEWKKAYLGQIKSEVNKKRTYCENAIVTAQNAITNYEKSLDQLEGGYFYYLNRKEYQERKNSLNNLIAAGREKITDYRQRINTLRPMLTTLQTLDASADGKTVQEAVAAADGLFKDTGFIQFDINLWNSADSLTDKTDGWFTYIKNCEEQANTAIETLFTETGSTSFAGKNYFDELDTELLKAQANLSYWKDELEIAQAVNEYAQKVDSTADSEVKTKEDLEKASQEYKRQIGLYEEAIAQIDEAYVCLEEKQAAVNEAQKILGEAKQAVDQARETYASVLVVLNGVDSNAIKQKIATLVLQIQGSWNMLSQKDGESGKSAAETALIDYYHDALNYANAFWNNNVYELRMELTDGEKGGGLSIKDLNEKAMAAAGFATTFETAPMLEMQDFLTTTGAYCSEKTFLIEDQLKILRDLSKSEEERKNGGLLIKKAFESIAYYFTNEKTKRENALAFIQSGEIENESRPYSEEERQVLQIRYWLQCQVNGLSVWQDGKNAEAYGRIMERLQEILDIADDSAFMERVINSRNDELLEGILQQTNVYEDESLFAWMQLEYAYLQEQTLLKIAGEQEVRNRYDSYVIANMNKKNSKALSEVIARIKSEDAIKGILTKDELYEWFKELREAGKDLLPASREALENYINGVLAYTAARDVYTASGMSEQSVQAQLDRYLKEYETESNNSAEYVCWKYYIATAAESMLLLSGETYAGLGEQEKSILDEYIGALVLGELTYADIYESKTAQELIQSIKNRLAANPLSGEQKQTTWEYRFLQLDTDIQQRIAGKTAALYHFNTEYEQYEVYADWLTLREKYAAKKISQSEYELGLKGFEKNAQISAYADAQDFLYCYDAYLFTLQHIQITPAGSDMLLNAAGETFASLIERYNKKNPDSRYDFEAELAEAKKGNEKAGAKELLEILGQNLAAALSLTVQEDERYVAADIEQRLETLLNEWKVQKSAQVKKDYEDSLSERERTYYAQVQKEDDATVLSEWYGFYLAGDEALYMYLLSNCCSIPQAASYLKNAEYRQKALSYYHIHEAAESYSALLDGDINEWLDSYTDSNGKNLETAERDAVYDFLAYGLPPENVFEYKDAQKQLVGEFGGGRSAAALQNKRRGAADTVINVAQERQEIVTENKKYDVIYIMAVKDELAAKKLEWLAQCKEEGVDDAADISEEEKEALSAVLKEKLEMEQAYLSRLLAEATAHLAWFTCESEQHGYADYINELAKTEEYERQMRVKMNAFENVLASDVAEKEIKLLINSLKAATATEGEINKELTQAEKEINAAQEAYFNRQNEWKDKVDALMREYTVYNTAVTHADSMYTEVTAARLEQRKAQEIFDWASSIYLQDFGSNKAQEYTTPKEKLSEVNFAYTRANIAVEVLRELKDTEIKPDEQYSELERAYKQSAQTYYLCRVIASEAAGELAKQEERVRKAEAAEKEAFFALIKKYENEGGDAKTIAEQLPQSDLIRITCTESIDEQTGETVYTYDISLAYGVTQVPDGYVTVPVTQKTAATELNTDILEQYLTLESEKVTIVGGVKTYTKAETDALEWFKQIKQKGDDYFNTIMLASLYLKSYGQGRERDGWLTNAKDPLNNHAYEIGDIPASDKFHNIIIADEYLSARKQVLKDAYEEAMSAGGSADIAKYILYRETSVNFDAQTRETRVLVQRSLAKVESVITQKVNEYQVCAAVAFGSSAALTAAAAFFQPWLFVPAAAAFVVGIYNQDRANSCRDLRTDVQTVINGNSSNLNSLVSDQNDRFEIWRKAKEKLDSERRILNTMYYGSETEAKVLPQMTYETFKIAMDKMLENSIDRVSQAEKERICSKDNFDKSGSTEETKSSSAIGRIRSYLESLKNTARENQTIRANELLRIQNENALLYYAKAEETQYISEQDRQELRKYALLAGDTTLSVDERKEAAKEYDRIADEITEDTAAVKAGIKALAEKTWGSGSYNGKANDLAGIQLTSSLYNSKTNYTVALEDFTEQAQQDYMQSVLTAYDNAASARLEARQKVWDLQRLDFAKQFDAWKEQAAQIQSIAQNEWTKAEGKVASGYNNWRKQFLEEYEKKNAEWENNYAAFLNEKRDWVNTQYLYAANIGNAGVLEQSGADVESVIAKTLSETVSIGQMEGEKMQVKEYVVNLLEGTRLRALMASADSLIDRGKNAAGAVKKGLERDAGGTVSLIAATKVMQNIQQEMEQAAAKLAAEQAEKILEESKLHYLRRLAAENEGMLEWEKTLALDAGYEVRAGEIKREAVTDSVLMRAIRETQKLHVYRAYETSEPEIKTKLDAGRLSSLDAQGIMRAVEQANRELASWGRRVFGETDGEGNGRQWQIPRDIADTAKVEEYAKSEEANKEKLEELGKLQKRGYENLSEGEKARVGELSSGLVTVRDGELGEHIGYAPEFKKEGLDVKKSREENIERSGRGEMGLIMLDFQWNSMRMKNGYAELAKPGYDKRLWDDSGSFFKAPTMRSVADIAMSIVTNVVSKIPGIGMVLGPAAGMFDDLLFAGLDLTGGYKSAEEIGKELGVKVLSAALNAATAGVGEKLSMDTVMNPLTKAAINAGMSVGSNVITTVGTNFIQNINFSQIGSSNWFNTENFNKTMGNVNTWSGTIGAAVTGGLNMATASDGLGKALSSVFNSKGIQSFNNLTGGLTSSAVTYTATGNVSFNILNIADIGGMFGIEGLRGLDKEGNHTGDYVRMGLLQMNMGKDGFSMEIGSGGTDLSASNLYNSIGGVTDVAKILTAKTRYMFGDDRRLSVMNASNGLGYSGMAGNKEDEKFAKDIWGGKLKTEFANIENEIGYYNGKENKDTIFLSNDLRGNNKEQMVKLATAMSHEGTHYNGNRVEGIAHITGLNTYEAIRNLYGMKSDDGFVSQMLGSIADIQNWKENTGDIYYWKLAYDQNGKPGWQEDGSFDFNIDTIGTITAENMQKYIEIMKYLQAGGVIISDATVRKDTLFTNTLAQLITGRDIKREGDYYSFLEGTEHFADASVIARDLYNGKLSQNGIDAMNAALYLAQNSGLLVKNEAETINTSRLIGSGTTENPYFPLTSFNNRKVYITSMSGFRLNDADMVKLGSNYPENKFAVNSHNGWDGVGSGDIVAPENGAYSIHYDKGTGLSLTLSATNSYEIGHAAASSIINYFSVLGQGETRLEYKNGNYQITGVAAGLSIGEMGSTGIYSTNPHGHMTVNKSRNSFGKIFNTDAYAPSYEFTDYAKYMTGYTAKSFDNPQLWKNVYNYSRKNPSLLNFDRFFYENSPTYYGQKPSSFSLRSIS